VSSSGKKEREKSNKGTLKEEGVRGERKPDRVA